MRSWLGPGIAIGCAAAVIAGACSRPARPADEAGHEPPRTPVLDAAGAGDAGSIIDAASAIRDAAIGDAAIIDAPVIIDAPIRWTAERAQLTLAYRRQHSDPTAADLTIDPHVIVLHYTSGDSAKATRGYFDNVRIEASRKDLARAGAVNVSAHFLVDRDGTIYQLQPADRFARHCIGLNHVAIGIENVGDEPKLPLTDAQVDADAALVRMLARQFKITHLLGHYEVMAFRADPSFVERDPAYRNDKPDPGPRFMKRVRAKVADLGLRGL